MAKLTADIKEMLVTGGSRKSALVLLQQKKKLETFWERMQAQKCQVEEQLMALEEVQTHSIIYESLAIAEKAQRVMQKDYESYSDLFAKIDENKSA
jgi:hypothetical protein